jgi:hypothetical protein
LYHRMKNKNGMIILIDDVNTLGEIQHFLFMIQTPSKYIRSISNTEKLANMWQTHMQDHKVFSSWSGTRKGCPFSSLSLLSTALEDVAREFKF